MKKNYDEMIKNIKLEGTEKQVAWAQEIIAGCLYVGDEDEETMAPIMDAYLEEISKAELTASQIIDLRYNFPTANRLFKGGGVWYTPTGCAPRGYAPFKEIYRKAKAMYMEGEGENLSRKWITDVRVPYIVELIKAGIWLALTLGYETRELIENVESEYFKGIGYAPEEILTAEEKEKRAQAAAKRERENAEAERAEIERKQAREEAERKQEEAGYEEIEVPYSVYKKELEGLYKVVEDSYDSSRKSIKIAICKLYPEKIEKVQKLLQSNADRPIVSVKYKDLKNDVWAGKIAGTVRDSYDSSTKTIQVYAVSKEAKETIEAYYDTKKKNAMPQEVRAFKEGWTDEYTITPDTINPDTIDNSIPEVLQNAG